MKNLKLSIKEWIKRNIEDRGHYIAFYRCPCTPHSLILEDLYSEPCMLSHHEENPIVSLFMSKTIPLYIISQESFVLPSLHDQR